MVEEDAIVIAEVVSEEATAPAATADAKDIEENKAYAILAYLGILVIVPVAAAPKSEFAQFHAKQGLNLWL